MTQEVINEFLMDAKEQQVFPKKKKKWAQSGEFAFGSFCFLGQSVGVNAAKLDRI